MYDPETPINFRCLAEECPNCCCGPFSGAQQLTAALRKSDVGSLRGEGEDDFIPQQIQDWGPSPEQRYAQTEMRDILRSVIDELPPDFRVVFVLRDVEGLSTEETAETVGISEAAVKSRLLRARLKLRQKLDRHFRQDGKQ